MGLGEELLSTYSRLQSAHKCTDPQADALLLCPTALSSHFPVRNKKIYFFLHSLRKTPNKTICLVALKAEVGDVGTKKEGSECPHPVLEARSSVTGCDILRD